MYCNERRTFIKLQSFNFSIHICDGYFIQILHNIHFYGQINITIQRQLIRCLFLYGDPIAT